MDYRFTITPNDDTTANNHTAVQSTSAHDFTWEARNYGGYPASVLSTSGLVSYWRLGESSGTTAFDTAPGGGNNGTYTNGPTLGSGGALTGDADTSTTFDGVNDWVEFGNPVSLQNTNGSIDAWIKTTNPGGQAASILCKASAYVLYVRSTGKLATFDWGTSTPLESSATVADGAWHHVAMTWQSGVTNGTTLYVDGTSVLTTTTTVAAQTKNVSIGSQGGGTQFFNGAIDDTAIYNRALTATEVKAHYDAGK